MGRLGRSVIFQFPKIAIVLLIIASPGRCWADKEQCGKQAGGALCHNELCCSAWGFCGSTDHYCGKGCQSQCNGTTPPPPPTPEEEYLISRKDFNEMLKHRDDDECEGKGFYTYEGFVEAAKTFPRFGNEGDTQEIKRDIAAFFGQSSHKTRGGSPLSPYDRGYCFMNETNPIEEDYCEPSSKFPCVPGKQYYGRGPFQIKGNKIYGECGSIIGVDLLNNPDLIATDPVISFKSAIWYWMRTPPPFPFQVKPSCHDAITGRWIPTDFDVSQRRFPGYGMTTYVIEGWKECATGWLDVNEMDRVGYYMRYCDILGVRYGDHLECFEFSSLAIS